MHDIIIDLSEITNYKLGDCLKITHTLGVQDIIVFRYEKNDFAKISKNLASNTSK